MMLQMLHDVEQDILPLGSPTSTKHEKFVPKWIAGSQFRFQQIRWQWFLYIVQKFGEIRSSDPRDYDARM